jgi:putative NIF3 family GTP cyclohydrolase 1 type 2
MKAQELQDYLTSLTAHGVRESVDRIIIGNPKTEIRKIGTCWLPYWETLREAHRKGVNVMVAHEPTFYHHLDLDARDAAYPEQVALKKKWITDRRMVIIRCHDVLDAIPSAFGIPFAWGRALGFEDRALAWKEKYFNVYTVRPAAAQTVARALARRMKRLGQPGVAFYGDPRRVVKTVGVGTGCYADPKRMARAPDLFVAIDDSIFTWCQTTFSADTGYPLVVANHGTSEEPAMGALRDQLERRFPKIPCIHFPQGCTYAWVPGR